MMLTLNGDATVSQSFSDWTHFFGHFSASALVLHMKPRDFEHPTSVQLDTGGFGGQHLQDLVDPVLQTPSRQGKGQSWASSGDTQVWPEPFLWQARSMGLQGTEGRLQQ